MERGLKSISLEVQSICGLNLCLFPHSEMYNWDKYLATDRTLTLISWSIRRKTVMGGMDKFNQMVAQLQQLCQMWYLRRSRSTSSLVAVGQCMLLHPLNREACKRDHFKQQGRIPSLFCFSVFMLTLLYVII